MKQYSGQLKITKEALIQIYSIKANDYTLGDCEFRIRIDGKGCSGFTYDMGFSKPLEGDILLTIPTQAGDIKILLDEFTDHYVQDAKLSYESSDEDDDIGFVLVNFNEKAHEGKFFEDETLLPNFN